MSISRTQWTWVEAVQRGENDAVEGFVRKYRGAVVGYLKQRGAGADAEDLAQEVFLALFDGGRALAQASRDKGRLRNLVFGITRRVYGGYLRKRGRLRHGGGVVHVSVGDQDAADADPDADFDRQWFLCLLDLAMQRLEAEHLNYYQALRGCLLEGRAQAEVADALGVTAMTVRNHVRRGKAKLSGYLVEELWAVTGDKGLHAAELDAFTRLLPGFTEP